VEAVAMSTKKAFLLAVASEMARTGVDRMELARRLGCTAQNIDQMLDPHRSGMRLETAERLARGLKCSLSLFLSPRIPPEPLLPDRATPRFEPEAPIHASVDQLCRWQDAARAEDLSLDEWMGLAADVAWNLFHREQERAPGGRYAPLIAAFWIMQGFSPKAAHALGLAKVRTWDQLQSLAPRELLKLVGSRQGKALLARQEANQEDVEKEA
jgi:DNA-binding Xre family transcriptional regulator